MLNTITANPTTNTFYTRSKHYQLLANKEIIFANQRLIQAMSDISSYTNNPEAIDFYILHEKTFSSDPNIKPCVINSEVCKNTNNPLLTAITPETINALNFFGNIQTITKNYYPEEYQELAKKIYELQDKPAIEQLKIFRYIDAIPSCNFKASKLNFYAYINGSYNIYLNEDLNYYILEDRKFHKLNQIVEHIREFSTILFNNNINYKISSFKKFIDNLVASNYIAPSIEKINKKIQNDSMQRFNDIIGAPIDITKQYTPSAKDIFPQYNLDDDFYLLYNTNAPQQKRDDFLLKIVDDNYNKIKQNSTQIQYIVTDLKKEHKYNIKFNLNPLYKYEPEIYQAFAKFCHDLHTDTSIPKSYYTIKIAENWNATKMSYKDYLQGNYKVIPIQSNGEITHRQLVKTQIKETKPPTEIIATLQQLANSTRYSNKQKIESLLPPLFASIHPNNKIAFDDFCLNAELIFGSIYQESEDRFESLAEDFLVNTPHTNI